VTIEFSCRHCGKALSTSDDKAGRKAKCPGCGEPILVPSPAEDLEYAAPADDAELDDLDADAPDITCPMCGAKNPPRTKACEACGEPLKSDRSQERRPQKIEAGEVLSAGWSIYKQEMGLVIGGCVITSLLGMAAGLPQQMMAMIAGMMQAQGEDQTAIILQTVSWCFLPLSYIAQWYLTCGLSRMLLNVARGQPAALGDIFSGAKYLWRMAGASIVFGIMVTVGFICLIIPGIILMLMFWPFVYTLVDEDPPGIDALWRTRKYTDGNWGAAFVLFLAAFAINILGVCALFVGVIFTFPLTSLMMAVAYCKMTGQRTVE
jgi:DNA-directed RNA polymerase subunit RPC12/RpoP